MDCHKASVDDADAITHEGQTIATVVSPKDCGRCHTQEEEQQRGSVHAEAVAVIKERMPAMVTNLAGPAIEAAGCAQCHGSTVKLMAQRQARSEHLAELRYRPDQPRRLAWFLLVVSWSSQFFQGTGA